MGGLFGFALAGMAEGVGKSIVDRAKAEREAALEEIRNGRLMQREDKDRAFRASEAEIQRKFQAEQADLDRGDAAKRAEADRYRALTPEEAKALGLPSDKKFQVSGKGQITQIGGGGVNVNVGDQYGKPPSGYSFAYDAEGKPLLDERGVPKLFPMSGGPEDPTTMNEQKAGQAEVATRVVTTAADRARQAAKDRDLGPYGQGLVEKMPWTDSAEVKRQVDVLKAEATIQNLNAMRAASPTGGALGSVTEKENAMLAAKTGALDPSSPSFLRDIDDYELTLLQIVHGPEAGQRIFDERRKMRDGGTEDPLGIR